MKKCILIIAFAVMALSLTAQEKKIMRNYLDANIKELVVSGNAHVAFVLDTANYLQYLGNPDSIITVATMDGNKLTVDQNPNVEDIVIGTKARLWRFYISDNGVIEYDNITYRANKDGSTSSCSFANDVSQAEWEEQEEAWRRAKEFRWHGNIDYGFTNWINMGTIKDAINNKTLLTSDLWGDISYDFFTSKHIYLGAGLGFGWRQYIFSTPIVTSSDWTLMAGEIPQNTQWSSGVKHFAAGIPLHLTYTPHTYARSFFFTFQAIPELNFASKIVQRIDYYNPNTVTEVPNSQEQKFNINPFNIIVRAKVNLGPLGLFVESSLLPIGTYQIPDGLNWMPNGGSNSTPVTAKPYHFAWGFNYNITKTIK